MLVALGKDSRDEPARTIHLSLCLDDITFALHHGGISFESKVPGAPVIQIFISKDLDAATAALKGAVPEAAEDVALMRDDLRQVLENLERQGVHPERDLQSVSLGREVGFSNAEAFPVETEPHGDLPVSHPAVAEQEARLWEFLEANPGRSAVHDAEALAAAALRMLSVHSPLRVDMDKLKEVVLSLTATVSASRSGHRSLPICGR